jgi:hypothetical protein
VGIKVTSYFSTSKKLFNKTNSVLEKHFIPFNKRYITVAVDEWVLMACGESLQLFMFLKKRKRHGYKIPLFNRQRHRNYYWFV